MSETVYEGAELTVSRFVGPVNEGADRRRWQFTTAAKGVAVLDFNDLLVMLHAVALDANIPEPP